MVAWHAGGARCSIVSLAARRQLLARMAWTVMYIKGKPLAAAGKLASIHVGAAANGGRGENAGVQGAQVGVIH